MKKILIGILVLMTGFILIGCNTSTPESEDTTQQAEILEEVNARINELESRIDDLEANRATSISEVGGEATENRQEVFPRAGIISIGEDIEAGVYNITTDSDWSQQFLLFRSTEEFDSIMEEVDNLDNDSDDVWDLLSRFVHRVPADSGISGFILREGYILDTGGFTFYFELE